MLQNLFAGALRLGGRKRCPIPFFFERGKHLFDVRIKLTLEDSGLVVAFPVFCNCPASPAPPKIHNVP